MMTAREADDNIAMLTMAKAAKAAAAANKLARQRKAESKKPHVHGPKLWAFACRVARQSLMGTSGYREHECGRHNDRNSPLIARAQEVLQEWRDEALAAAGNKRHGEMKEPAKTADKVVAVLQQAQHAAKRRASTSSSTSSDEEDDVPHIGEETTSSESDSDTL